MKNSQIRRIAIKRGVSATFVTLGVIVLAAGCGNDSSTQAVNDGSNDPAMVAQGQQTFRFDTFGDESMWTDTLQMHDVIATAVDPTTALSVGLKVDADALPAAVVPGIQNGTISLTSPATTVALLKLNAVVGVQGTVDHRRERQRHADQRRDHLRALPLDRRQLVRARHRRAARRLAQPRPEPGRDHRAVAGAHRRSEGGLQLLGPGHVRPALQPRRHERPAVIPPAYGLNGIHSDHRHRRRQRPRVLEPLRRRHPDGRPRHVHRAAHRRQRHQRHRRSGQRQAARPAGLPAHARRAAAARRQLRRRRRRARQDGVRGAGAAARRCHSGALSPTPTARCTTRARWSASPSRNGAPSYASRSATKKYRTAPLAGLWQHPPYFHNGSAATLDDVVRDLQHRKVAGPHRRPDVESGRVSRSPCKQRNRAAPFGRMHKPRAPAPGVRGCEKITLGVFLSRTPRPIQDSWAKASRPELGSSSGRRGEQEMRPGRAGQVGDMVACEALMRRHNQRLYRVIRSVLRTGSDVEDAHAGHYFAALATSTSSRGAPSSGPGC